MKYSTLCHQIRILLSLTEIKAYFQLPACKIYSKMMTIYLQNKLMCLKAICFIILVSNWHYYNFTGPFMSNINYMYNGYFCINTDFTELNIYKFEKHINN